MNLLLVFRRWSRLPDDQVQGHIELNGRRVGAITLRAREWDALERGHVTLTMGDLPGDKLVVRGRR